VASSDTLHLADRDAIRVAVCQVAPRIGDVAGNMDRAVAAVSTAARVGAQLIVLPELVTSGYVFRDLDEVRRVAEPADGPTTRRLAALAREHDLIIVAGFPERSGDVIYNSAVLVDPSGIRAVYRKAHLWDRESDFFTPGSAPPPVVETTVGRIGVVVCYDLEFPEWMRAVALQGADVVCAPTNWPAERRPEGERPMEVVRVQASASVNRVFFAVADRAGRERGVEWASASAIIGPDGYPLALADASGEEQIVTASCLVKTAADKRTGPRNDVFADRRPELYARRAGE
jgi:predicted amidohydrolase